jgi:hypothetical protein
MLITEQIICKNKNNLLNKSNILQNEQNSTLQQPNSHIACSDFKFWIMMLIVCSNWRETETVLLTFSILTNSPITCLSIKNLQSTKNNTQNSWKNNRNLTYGNKNLYNFLSVLLKIVWIMLVSVRY